MKAALKNVQTRQETEKCARLATGISGVGREFRAGRMNTPKAGTEVFDLVATGGERHLPTSARARVIVCVAPNSWK